jgi:hypothetical protein
MQVIFAEDVADALQGAEKQRIAFRVTPLIQDRRRQVVLRDQGVRFVGSEDSAQLFHGVAEGDLRVRVASALDLRPCRPSSTAAAVTTSASVPIVGSWRGDGARLDAFRVLDAR